MLDKIFVGLPVKFVIRVVKEGENSTALSF
jgi:hypothetical protein